MPANLFLDFISRCAGLNARHIREVSLQSCVLHFMSFEGGVLLLQDLLQPWMWNQAAALSRHRFPEMAAPVDVCAQHTDDFYLLRSPVYLPYSMQAGAQGKTNLPHTKYYIFKVTDEATKSNCAELPARLTAGIMSWLHDWHLK